jgi:hypothetical protein
MTPAGANNNNFFEKYPRFPNAHKQAPSSVPSSDKRPLHPF